MSDTKKYLSSYGGGKIRGAQWITEKLCSVLAKKQGKELPDKFWSLAGWKKIFTRQVQMASSLLLLYDAESVYRALKDKRLKNIRSFGAFNYPFFSSVLEKYQSSLDAENSATEILIEERSTKELPTKLKKQNKLSILKELDVEARPIQSG